MLRQKSLELLRTEIEGWFKNQNLIKKVSQGDIYNLDPDGDERLWPRLHVELLSGGLDNGTYNIRCRFYFADLLDNMDTDFLTTWPIWSDLLRIAYDFRLKVLIGGSWTDDEPASLIPDKNQYLNNLAVIAFEQNLVIGVIPTAEC